MGKHKHSMAKRLLSFLLAVLLVLGLLPASAFATGEGRFVLVAEAGGKLVIEPEYVTYTAGQTVGDALAKSGHEFVGLDVGWISEIDGTVGNYSRSDQDGGFDLSKAAADVRFYRFCESEDVQPSEGLQKLMTAMAEYQNKDADVKAAAKEAYEAAATQFVGLDSDSAALLADELNEAVLAYEAIQSGPQHQVNFTDGSNNYVEASITVENAYGKTWSDDGDGIMALPAGTYDFCISQDGLWAEGSINVTGDTTVSAALPKQMWLKQEAFRLSGSYGDEDNEETKFTDDEYTLEQWNERSLDVSVKDTFTGKIYTYAEYEESYFAEVPELKAVYTSEKTGEETEAVLPFESLNSGIANVLKKGSAGKTVIYRISSTGEDGYTYSQDYTVNFHRTPSLTGITVKDQDGIDQASTTSFDSSETAYTYKVVDSTTEVTVEATPLEESYEITINGQTADGSVAVPLNSTGNTEIPIVVRAGDYQSTYILTICPGEGKKISFITERLDVTLEVVNQNGEVLPYAKFREGTSGNRYQYTLVPGETYNYVASCGSYYHIADEFTMEDVADSTIQVDVPTEDWLTELAFGTKTSGTYKNTLPLDCTFAAAQHAYSVDYIDTEHNAYIWVSGDSDAKIEAIYEQKTKTELYHGKTQTKELTSGSTTGLQLNRFLMDENPIENTLTVRLAKEIDGITCYQDYLVDFHRILTLQALSAQCDGVTTMLVQENEAQTAGFAPAVREYSVTVSMAAETLDLFFTRYTDSPCYGESEVGYRVKVDDTDVTEAGAVSIALDGTMETQTVTVTVENEKAPNGTGEYILHILKSPPVDIQFNMTPENGLVAMYETMSGQRLWPNDNGTFQVCEGYSYDYAATAFGYVSKSGTLTVTRDEAKALVVIDGDKSYTVTESEEGGGMLTLDWELAKAEINQTIRTDITAEWKNFRGNDENNGVTDAAIPTAAENGTLYWASQIGSGYSANAVGSPILVDGDLVTYAGNKIYRVDTVTGEIKVTGTMDHKSAHATTPPSYANGMVFVALTDGTVQAFNADTLESLWIYKDPLGGQPVCPLTIHDGYLYTGFWNSESGDANFVCLSITDENPTLMDESKAASWYHTAKGGYYWAGAYVCDDYLLIGTDDGTSRANSQTSSMLLFDPATGRLMDSWDELNGDIRSSVVYDSATDAYYFTAKGGTFYSVQVAKDESGWYMTNKWSVALENGTNGIPMSTCSPSVYNGRAYVGVSGEGQFAAYSGHNITVIDLNQQAIAYRVATQGYPQTSGLLTTAYEEESGYVYVYFFDNMTPGKLRVLRDKAGQTKVDYVTTEGSHSTAYALFTPTGEQAQYAICSPIVDEYGTVYFKNDSAHMMAFGSTIKNIKVTKNPNKMNYKDGDAFDPTGMVVTATYVNGKTRDITDYVKFDKTTITEEDTTVTISFPYVMYHNVENGTEMESGISSTTPVTTLDVIIGDGHATGEHIWDDGTVTVKPTCTKEGVKTYTCICGAEKTESIKAKGHTEITVAGKAATCTASGLTEGKRCSVCGETTVVQKTIKAKGHTKKQKITAATMSDNGKVVTSCSTCKKTLSTETIKKIKTVKLSYTKKNYTGKYITAPSLTVKDSGGNVLVKGTDYTVTGLKNKKSVGRYKVTVTFTGKYDGKKNLYFTIVPKAPDKVTAELYGYDDVKVAWSKATGASGYTVYYKKSSAKSYTRLINTTKTYVNKSNLDDGKKYVFKVVPYYVSGSTKYTSLTSKTDNVYTLKKVSNLTVTKSGLKVKVKWTNINGETGYQISKSTKKKGTNIVATYKTTTGTYKKISATKGKTYYYKVRAYKKVTINGKSKTIYGPWSAVKAFKRR